MHFFQGSDEYLQIVKSGTSLPVLRKDFMVDPYQIYESRAIGADCILLIAAILDQETLHTFHDLARSLDLDVLVEVHNREELEKSADTFTEAAWDQQPEPEDLRGFPQYNPGPAGGDP